MLYICIYILFIFIWGSPFIQHRNLDDVFNDNHMALMSLRSCSRVKASIVLTRAYNVFNKYYLYIFI